MEQIRITQCPKCDTTFRITPSQLKVAKGAVRCGACLHVFRASDHFQNAPEASPKVQDDRTHDLFKQDPTPAKPEVKPQPEPANQAPVDEPVSSDPVLDDLFATHDDSLAQAHEQVTDEQTGLDETLIDDDDGLVSDDPTIEDDEYGLIDDNSPLIEVEEGLIDDSGYLQEQTAKPEFNEDFLSLGDQNYEDPFFSDGEKLHDTIDKTDEDDEAWAQALLDDSDETEEPARQKVNNPINTPKPAASLNSAKPAFSYIEVDPLDLSLPQKTKQRQMLIWLSASALLVMLLLLQAAYFNFNQWARQDSYRPFYQVACEYLKCTVPSSYDLARIRTTASPQVSTHSRFKNALVVDVLFINGADYPQAFPRLSLTFSDKSEQVVAHRVFNAHEYLAGEAAGLTMMPAQTPIHIALEINDPGPTANNYQVRFLQP